MISVRVVTDNAECRDLWQKVVPQEVLPDLWQFRDCFNRYYTRDPYFVVAESNNEVMGLLPLCYIPEHKYYAYFPGETWYGLTWIEQNRIIARDKAVFDAMFDFLKQNNIAYHLRYLLQSPYMDESNSQVDEIGYLFVPPTYDFQMESYYKEFSNKSYKAIRKEVQNFEEMGLSYRIGFTEDLEDMIALNVERFGNSSYFAEPKFANAFRDLGRFCQDNNMLRMVTSNIKYEAAAIDMGILYNGAYTLLAGGTSGKYKGIAKAINLHHMEYSCQEKYKSADFLCGNFSWKTMFHLTPRPLYLMTNTVIDVKKPE